VYAELLRNWLGPD